MYHHRNISAAAIIQVRCAGGQYVQQDFGLDLLLSALPDIKPVGWRQGNRQGCLSADRTTEQPGGAQGARWVDSDEIKKAIAGREGDVLWALNIAWSAGTRGHIQCLSGP
jgi:hypothetical protein